MFSHDLITRKRQTNWSYEQRWEDSGQAAGLDLGDALASANGAHFHIWVPKSNPETELNIIMKALQALDQHRDVVGWSWDYIPTEKGPLSEEERQRFFAEMEGNLQGHRDSVELLLDIISDSPEATAALREWLKEPEAFTAESEEVVDEEAH